MTFIFCSRKDVHQGKKTAEEGKQKTRGALGNTSIHKMATITRAAFDIGSAATKLQVAVVDPLGGHVRKVLFAEERRCFFSLDLSRSTDNRLSAAVQDEGVTVLRELQGIAKGLGAQQVAAVATEVFRRATNGAAYLERVRAETGIAVQLVTQQDEALLGLRTATGLCGRDANPDTLVSWDSGGASFQIAAMAPGGGLRTYVGPLGSSVATALCLKKLAAARGRAAEGAAPLATPNPMTYEEVELLADELQPSLVSPAPQWLRGVVHGVGGPNSLFQLASSILESNVITLPDVYECVSRATGRNDAELMRLCQVTPDHDPVAMVLPKLVLLRTVMEHCRIQKVVFIPAIGSCAGILVSNDLYPSADAKL